MRRSPSPKDVANKLKQQVSTLRDLTRSRLRKTRPMQGEDANPDLPVPMAAETFVTSLGIDLTDEQRTQWHGLSRGPTQMKRRSTSAGKRMDLRRLHRDSVGNTLEQGISQGQPSVVGRLTHVILSISEEVH